MSSTDSPSYRRPYLHHLAELQRGRPHFGSRSRTHYRRSNPPHRPRQRSPVYRLLLDRLRVLPGVVRPLDAVLGHERELQSTRDLAASEEAERRRRRIRPWSATVCSSPAASYRRQSRPEAVVQKRVDNLERQRSNDPPSTSSRTSSSRSLRVSTALESTPRPSSFDQALPDQPSRRVQPSSSRSTAETTSLLLLRPFFLRASSRTFPNHTSSTPSPSSRFFRCTPPAPRLPLPRLRSPERPGVVDFSDSRRRRRSGALEGRGE